MYRAATSPKFFFKDGFELQAQKIYDQVMKKGFATKEQMEYLIAYNNVQDIEECYHFPDDVIEGCEFLQNDDEQEKAETSDSEVEIEIPMLSPELK